MANSNVQLETEDWVRRIGFRRNMANHFEKNSVL